MYNSLLKVPHTRLGVFIGEKGEGKKHLEKELGVTLQIDSSSSEISFSSEDSLAVFTAEKVLKAIARGFTPEQALLLLRDEYTFELLDLYDYLGKSQKKLVRFRARLIGSEGKVRHKLEILSGAYVVVYGKTVGIIGQFDAVHLARRAIEGLLSGMSHGAVIRWIKKQSERTVSDDSS